MRLYHLHFITGYLAAVAIGGCSVTLTDETSRYLYSAPPANVQQFRAEVETTGPLTLQSVAVALENGYTSALTGSGEGLWQGGVPVAACEESVAYRYIVEYQQNSTAKVKTFPDAGRYVRQISGLDPSCAGLINASQSFLVNTETDLADAAPGDGACAAVGDAELCSLRAAVMEANAHPGPDLIQLPPGRYRLTRSSASTVETDAVANDSIGDLDITDSLGIIGTGSRAVALNRILHQADSDVWQRLDAPAANERLDDPGSDSRIAKIDGAQTSRVLQVHPGPHYLVLENLTVTGGHVQDGPGAGILSAATTRLERVVIHDNELSAGTGAGGVFSANRGVGIYTTADLAGKDVAIVHNKVRGVTGIAGGLWLSEGAHVTLENALIAFNQARFAAAIYVQDEPPAGSDRTQLTLVNTTIAKNANTGTVRHALAVDGAKAELSFVTLAHNNRGGLVSSDGGTVRLSNSLIVDNGLDATDCSGQVTSGLYNIVGTTNSTCNSGLGTTDTTSALAFELRESLTYEGGFAHVLRLYPSDSASYTRIVDAHAGALIAPAQDARGAARKIDGRADGSAEYDPGAFEYRP